MEHAIDGGVVEAMAAFGAGPDDLTRAESVRGDRPFEVWPENWKAVQLFLALSTQWRFVGISTMVGARIVQTGLDYSAVESIMRLMDIKPRRRAALFKKLQIMEQAALDIVLVT